MQLAQKMLSKRKVPAAEDEKEAPPAKKTKKEKSEETAKHSEEVAHILEGYCQGLFELLQIYKARHAHKRLYTVLPK